VRLGVLPAEVVGVIGCDDAQPELAPQAEHALGDQLLLGNAVFLDFEPEPLGSEGAGEPLRRPPGLLEIALAQVERHFARQAGREADEPLGMGGQHLPVDAGTAVEPLGESDRAQPDEVFVADPVPGKEHQVAVGGGGTGDALAGGAGAKREVGLEAEDGADLFPPGLVVEGPGRVQVPVIRHGQAVHAQLLDVRDQVRQPVGPVEEGVLAVRVEMDERHGYPTAQARVEGRRSKVERGSRRPAYFSRASNSPSTASSGTPRTCSKTSK